jgi:hypothetical protein
MLPCCNANTESLCCWRLPVGDLSCTDDADPSQGHRRLTAATVTTKTTDASSDLRNPVQHYGNCEWPLCTALPLLLLLMLLLLWRQWRLATLPPAALHATRQHMLVQPGDWRLHQAPPPPPPPAWLPAAAGSRRSNAFQRPAPLPSLIATPLVWPSSVKGTPDLCHATTSTAHLLTSHACL